MLPKIPRSLLRNVGVFMLVMYTSFPSQAQNYPKSTIEKHFERGKAILTADLRESQELAKNLRQIANTIDNNFWIGTMWNEVDSKKHTCYALGQLLGQTNAIKHLRFTRIDLARARKSRDAYTLRVYAQSLDNFEYSVEQALRVTHGERATQWNLDCLGHVGIRGLPIQIEGPTTFYKLQNRGEILQILGDIEPGFSSQLRKILENNPLITTISLGSGGGAVYEALEAGRLIRSKNLDTMLWNNCYSACPLVFAGGKNRTIWSPYPYLGFHKVYTKSGAAPLHSQVYRDIAGYLTEMGIAPHFVLANMLSAEPHEMKLIRANQQLCDYGLATWIQRLC